MSITLDDIRQQVRQRAMMETSQMISGGDDNDSPELDNLINLSLGDLYDLLVLSSNEYFLDAYEITTTNGVTNYTLPANFYKLWGVDLDYGGETMSLKEFNFRERNWYKNVTIYARTGIPDMRYRILENDITLHPTPIAAYAITIWFVPQMARLTSSSSVVKNTIVESWIEYVLCDVTATMLAKEESDNSYWLNRKFEVKKRIIEAAESRNWGEPQKIVDIYRADSDDWR